MLLLLLTIILVLLFKPLIEPFQTLENKPVTPLNLNDFSTISDIVETSPPPVITGARKNIIESKEVNNLQQINFVIKKYLELLNKSSSVTWTFLELINVSEEIVSPNQSAYNIELFVVSDNDTPLHLSIQVLFSNFSGTLKVNKTILYLSDSKFDKAIDPSQTNHFQIKNMLGLLSPFKTSEPRLVTPEDVKIFHSKKSSKPSPFCFSKPSIKSRQNCIASDGIWDKPVTEDTECPFFRSNIHYPNKRGGSKGGFCELPSGLQLQGFRFVNPSPEFKPLCYNCKSKPNGGTDTCCDDQLDPSKYPNLNSYPDYKFPGDSIERSHFSSSFTSNNLNHK